MARWQDIMPRIPLDVGVPVLWNATPFVVTSCISDDFVVVVRCDDTVDPMKATRILTDTRELKLDLDNPIGYDYAKRWATALTEATDTLKHATASACVVALKMSRGKMV